MTTDQYILSIVFSYLSFFITSKYYTYIILNVTAVVNHSVYTVFKDNHASYTNLTSLAIAHLHDLYTHASAGAHTHAHTHA